MLTPPDRSSPILELAGADAGDPVTDELKKTPLHDRHLAAGAKMVDFTGFHMPLQYGDGILAEHKAVREGAGLFDVSHMGEAEFRGPRALEAIQKLVTNDASKLEDNRALYTAVCLPSGGIVDDCIVYRFGPEHFRIVINASNIDKDLAHFREYAGHVCDISDLSDQFALLAIQGPKAVAMTNGLCDADLADIPPFGLGAAHIAGVDVVAARTGYTGEDGFELFVPAEGATAVWDALVEAGAKPIGLGARDTLRLEARLCLYGNDIDESTSPLEAGLGWTVKLAKGVDFVGAEVLREQKSAGVQRKLVGFSIEGRGIARPGWDVVDGEEVVGQVTSGGPAPTVGGAVGMAYVPAALAAPGTTLTLRKGKKTLSAVTVKGPFYKRPA